MRRVLLVIVKEMCSCVCGYQSVLADDEDALSAVNLS